MGRLSYWLDIFFSAGIATFGPVLHSPAATIGGENPVIMGGAGLLFLTNLVAIVASAFGVFLLGRF